MKLGEKSRGRPKTLIRDEVLNVAMIKYWEQGASQVSISDISKALQVSKPGVYREFGNDDGLKAAALQTYQKIAVDPFLGLLRCKKPLTDTSMDIITFLMQDRDALGIPKSCLFVNMRMQRDKMGPETMKVLDWLRTHFLESFATWIDNCKITGEFRQDIPTMTAAHQIDSLHAGAMRMQKENVPAEEIELYLKHGLAGITGETRILSQ
ncbi:TetR/AcrR family transcriptional regulator [Roseibium sp. TrichSKD4]|uniref:TetR/AcrR family transcriptional regulator n=1 Tax=Roseibium sp. TrichSKD4 TaxID=744980 RepID=UPI000680C342|nr:TetR/AcrR family transcriptional regulator [Roseibium sp. TrichSKD4]